MREIFRIAVERILPDPAGVLGLLGYSPSDGVPAPGNPADRLGSRLRTALELLAAHSSPAAILAEITVEEFDAVYRGEGRNEPFTPLGGIFPRADRLALFAVTLGEAVSARISDLFASRDFAVGSMLDAAASGAAENAADAVQDRFAEIIGKDRGPDPARRLLRYSPGYCGWHMSGQQALFAHLRPEEIGIRLGASFLMQPLKTISGVIVAGPAEIHRFAANYPFCAECVPRSCCQRLLQVPEG